MIQYLTYNTYWSIPTLLLYLGIIFVCVFFASRKKKVLKIARGGCGSTNKLRIDYRILIISLILLFFKCFGTTGRDLRNGYYINFNTATSMDAYRDQSVEFGFRLINVIIKNLTGSYEVFLIVIGIATIIPVMYILNKYSDKIDLGIAVLVYTSCFYFTSFSAYRQYLAVTITLLIFDALYEKKAVKALILILLGSSVHITVLFSFIPYFIMIFKKVSKRMIVASFFILIVMLFAMRGTLSSLLVGRYAIYSAFDTVSVGGKYFIYYLPLFYLYYRGKKCRNDKQFDRLSLSYLGTGFTFGLMEYIISIFGRFQAMTIPIMIIIPYYSSRLACHKKTIKRLMMLAIFGYCLLRFWVFITESYNQEDLMPYTNIFGWTI